MASVKYQGRKKIKSHAKHIFTSNILPQVSDTTDGFFRRLNILLFEKKFVVGNSNFDINEFYKQENLDYLANLGLRSYLKMLKNGQLEFANKEESLQIIQHYKRINNTILGFLLDEDSEELFDQDIRTKEMWQEYKSFCIDNRFEPLTKVQFYDQLTKQYGFVKKAINGVYYFYQPKSSFVKKISSNFSQSELSEFENKNFLI